MHGILWDAVHFTWKGSGCFDAVTKKEALFFVGNDRKKKVASLDDCA